MAAKLVPQFKNNNVRDYSTSTFNALPMQVYSTQLAQSLLGGSYTHSRQYSLASWGVVSDLGT